MPVTRSAPTSTAGIDPLPGAGTTPVVVHATNTRTALLTAVRAARHEGFDRVVFQFSNVLPGYDVRYVRKPVRQDGSGRIVPVRAPTSPGSGWRTRSTPTSAEVGCAAELPGSEAVRPTTPKLGLRTAGGFESPTPGPRTARPGRLCVMTPRPPPRLVRCSTSATTDPRIPDSRRRHPSRRGGVQGLQAARSSAARSIGPPSASGIGRARCAGARWRSCRAALPLPLTADQLDRAVGHRGSRAPRRSARPSRGCDSHDVRA